MQLSDFKFFSWHHQQWQVFRQQSRPPQSLLIAGPEGIGKSAFARAIAAYRLCLEPTANGPCGACDSCRWLAAGNHPDFVLVEPEEAATESEEGSAQGDKKKGRRQIVIDQIRALSDFVYVGAHRGGAKVILIDPASAMNLPAANSLLKILEEPPVNVYFILVTRNQENLIATIRSRCSLMKLPKPSPEIARAWLRQNVDPKAETMFDFAGGTPLAAARAFEDQGDAVEALVGSFAQPDRLPTELAARWERALQGGEDRGLRMEDFVIALQKWLVGLSMLKASSRSRFLGQFAPMAGELAQRASATGLLRCYNDLLKIRALASHPLNARLMLEDMAERYLRALALDRR